MITVSFNISIPSHKGKAVLEIAQWLGLALEQEPIDGMVIHELHVEENDA